jgi:hypothetical protein
VQEAWRLYHQGEFQAACELGLSLGLPGYAVANKAATIYATYLEDNEKKKLALFEEAAARGEEQMAKMPKYANAYYFYALALGRYSQGISVAKALAQGLGTKVRDALTQALKLEPNHADAHIALGAFHAEVINKVGAMVGGLTYGAKKDDGRRALREGAQAQPGFGHRPHRVRQRPGDAVRRGEDEAGREALPRGRRLQAGGRHGAPRRRGWPRRNWKNRFWEKSVCLGRRFGRRGWRPMIGVSAAGAAAWRGSLRGDAACAASGRAQAPTPVPPPGSSSISSGVRNSSHGSSSRAYTSFSNSGRKRETMRSGSVTKWRSVTRPNCTLAVVAEDGDAHADVARLRHPEHLLRQARPGHVERLLRAGHVGHHRRGLVGEDVEGDVLHEFRRQPVAASTPRATTGW